MITCPSSWGSYWEDTMHSLHIIPYCNTRLIPDFFNWRIYSQHLLSPFISQGRAALSDCRDGACWFLSSPISAEQHLIKHPRQGQHVIKSTSARTQTHAFVFPALCVPTVRAQDLSVTFKLYWMGWANQCLQCSSAGFLLKLIVLQ